MSRCRLKAGRETREGMILLNVLIIVAIAAAAVAIMIASEDIEVQRSIRLHDAAQAQAYARAGELSAVVALRRDGYAAPDLDAYSEPWAAIGQEAISVPGGRFALAIADEQARFNINSLTQDDPVAAAGFARLAAAAGVNPTSAATMATLVGAVGPLRDEGLLRTAGIDPADLFRLRPFIAYLPPDARLNLNTADAGVLGALLDNPDRLREILTIRTRNGRLTDADVAGVGLTDLGGLTSSHFLVTTTVRVGDVTQTTRSRLDRIIDPSGVRVAISGRRRTAD